MAKNREILSLGDSAFAALLRNHAEIMSKLTPHSPASHASEKLKKAIPLFLQAIADANPTLVKNLLKDNPLLAVAALGTVTTSSGYTYKSVTGVQLAFLMDDDELMKDALLPVIEDLPKEMIETVKMQLASKKIEVEQQRAKFKPYDFRKMVEAISADSTIENRMQSNDATQNELEKFKKDFKPGHITEGKSWIKEQIQEAFRIYDQNSKLWSNKQAYWYLVNIIGHLQTLSEKCFEQECSQGLNQIIDFKNERSVEITNSFNDVPMTFRSSADSLPGPWAKLFC